MFHVKHFGTIGSLGKQTFNRHRMRYEALANCSSSASRASVMRR
jgi:hypothetical protein